MKLRNPLLFLIVFLLAACAQLGIADADTCKKKVAAAGATVQTIYETSNAAYQADKLSETDMDNVINVLNASLTSLRAALPMCGTDPAGAQTKLSATLQILTALNAYLVAHQGKPS